MKLNRMICPTCGHETLTDCAYTRCDACGVMFYANQSRGAKVPTNGVTLSRIYINGVPVPQVWPLAD